MNNPWYEVFVELEDGGTMTLEHFDTYEDAWNWKELYSKDHRNPYRGQSLHIDKWKGGDGWAEPIGQE